MPARSIGSVSGIVEPAERRVGENRHEAGVESVAAAAPRPRARRGRGRRSPCRARWPTIGNQKAAGSISPGRVATSAVTTRSPGHGRSVDTGRRPRGRARREAAHVGREVQLLGEFRRGSRVREHRRDGFAAEQEPRLAVGQVSVVATAGAGRESAGECADRAGRGSVAAFERIRVLVTTPRRRSGFRPTPSRRARAGSRSERSRAVAPRRPALGLRAARARGGGGGSAAALRARGGRRGLRGALARGRARTGRGLGPALARGPRRRADLPTALRAPAVRRRRRGGRGEPRHRPAAGVRHRGARIDAARARAGRCAAAHRAARRVRGRRRHWERRPRDRRARPRRRGGRGLRPRPGGGPRGATQRRGERPRGARPVLRGADRGAPDLRLRARAREPASSELLPVLPRLAGAVRPGGHAIFSGLLVSERREVEAALATVGLAVCGVREEPDPSGDAWLGLLTRR